jgi:hypothetical protein
MRHGLKSKRFAEKMARTRLNLKVLVMQGAAPAACNAL